MEQTLDDAVALLTSELTRELKDLQNILLAVATTKEEGQERTSWSTKSVKAFLHGFEVTVQHVEQRYKEILLVLEALQEKEKQLIESFKLKCELCFADSKIN